MRRAALVLVMSAALGCPPAATLPAGCGKDTDCKGARICVAHACVDPPPKSAAAAPPDPAPAAVDGGVSGGDGGAGDGGSAAAPAPAPIGASQMFHVDALHTGRSRFKAPLAPPKETMHVATGGVVYSSPAITDDGTLVFGSHDKSVYAVDAAGKIRWRHPTGDLVWGSPALGPGGVAYVGSDDDRLYAFDLADGNVRWTFQAGPCRVATGVGPEGARCDVDGVTVAPDGTVYAAADGLYALSPDGKLKWKFAPAVTHCAATPAVGPDGTVYVGCRDDALYAVGPDGVARWSFRAGDDVDSSPAVGADGTVYVGSDDHKLYALGPGGAAALGGGHRRADPQLARRRRRRHRLRRQLRRRALRGAPGRRGRVELPHRRSHRQLARRRRRRQRARRLRGRSRLRRRSRRQAPVEPAPRRRRRLDGCHRPRRHHLRRRRRPRAARPSLIESRFAHEHRQREPVESPAPGPYEGLRSHELAATLNADVKGRHRLRTLLDILVDENIVEKAPGNRFRLVGAAAARAAAPASALPAGWVAGSLRVHPAGYGFVARDDGEDDVYVAARNRASAMDGDRVAISTWLGYKGTEGRIEKVLERGRAKLTGTCAAPAAPATSSPTIRASPPPAATCSSTARRAAPRTGRRSSPRSRATRRAPTSRSRRASSTCSAIPTIRAPRSRRSSSSATSRPSFPTTSCRPPSARPPRCAPRTSPIASTCATARFMTIDPETARDFDDAVCVEPSPKGPGWARLWVAVADVSHYVPAGLRARPRGARARLLGLSARPRHPDAAASSSRRGSARSTPRSIAAPWSCAWRSIRSGDVHDEYFCAAVIRSKARLDYPGVAAALAGDFRGSRARYREFLPELERMAALAKKLRVRRLDARLARLRPARGQGASSTRTIRRRVRDVVQSRGDAAVKGAYQLVEDFMLAANEAVARHFRERELDTVWRVHDVPSDERLQQFAELAHAFGLHFDAEAGRSPKKLKDFLALARTAGRWSARSTSCCCARSSRRSTTWSTSATSAWRRPTTCTSRRRSAAIPI